MVKNMKSITIYDIAKEAGVSPATVSRILTGSTTVSEEKRQKVQKLIEKYDFRPNAMARGLTVSSSKTIGMLVPDAQNPYYNSVFSSCCNAAYEKGYSMLLLNTFSDPAREKEALAKLIEQRVDAVIISGGRCDLAVQGPLSEESLRLISNRCRVVITSYSNYPEFAGICIDHRGCLDLAVDHLISLGHRDIGFVYAGPEYIGTKWKLDRLKEKLESYGLPFRKEWMIESRTYAHRGGRSAAHTIAELDQRPTAVIALNDVLAAGLLQGFHEVRIDVPGKISVIGFDNAYLTDITSPSITSVGYDYDAFGAMVVDYAVGEHAQDQGINLLIPGELVCRDSTDVARRA